MEKNRVKRIREKMISDNEDDIPPLEDLSLELVQLSKERIRKNPFPKVSQGIPPKVKEKEFNGLKKGFFNSSESKQDKPGTKTNQIPLVKPKDTQSNSLKFDSVQEAMSNHISNSQSSWLTPDFLDKIEASPALSKAFNDPTFRVAMNEMARNPKETIQKFKHSRPDLLAALQEFTDLFSNQLIATENPLPNHEQEIVNKVTQSNLAKDALQDSVIQKLLSQAQRNPAILNESLKNGPDDVKRKLHELIKCGLLKFE